MDKRCQNCRYYEHEEIDDGFVCVNDESEYVADWVDEEFVCIDWEGKYEP